jgi:hypothetical protein
VELQTAVRTKPYTERGIKRIPCARCGGLSSTQWQICGDGNQFRGLCVPCDVALNILVMRWIGLPFDAVDYERRLRASL